MVRTVYIALGSNLGDREAILRRALTLLDAHGRIDVVGVSGFHRTAPVGGPAGQGEYLNAAAELRTDLSPLQLMETLQGVEAALGRDRPKEQRCGPRRCDLDILLIEDLVVQSERLTVPHPRLAERLFVLRPLAEIAPQAICPPGSKTVRQLLAELEGRS